VSAVPAPQRQAAGWRAAAEWAQIGAAAPLVAAVMRRYLRQLGTFLAPASVVAAENALRQLARWMITEAGLAAVGDIRRDDIEDFKVWLAAQPRSGGRTITKKTHRQRMRTVRAFFERIIERDWPQAPPRNPVIAGDIPKKPEPLPKFPGDRDAARLMAAARASADPRDRLVAGLLARTGMRAGELAGLEAGAVVRIGAGHWLHIPLGKLRTDRYVPLHPELVSLLAAWTAANLEHIRRHNRLAAGHRGPLDRHVICRIVHRVGRAAGVPGVHPHRLRHTLATQAINRGMRLEAIAALLGQKMEMTLIYAKIANRVAADEYAAVSAKTGRPLRAAADAARRLRNHRHGPAAPRSTRPDARQRAVHPPRRTRLPDGIGLRDLRLLPHRHTVPPRPSPPARPRPRPRPSRPGRAVRPAHPAHRNRARRHRTELTTMPQLRLDLSDAAELAEMLTFLTD
jgi:integrase